MIQLISRNQRAVSPEAQPRVIQPSDCEIYVLSHDWQNSRLLIGQLEGNMRLY